MKTINEIKLGTRVFRVTKNEVGHTYSLTKQQKSKVTYKLSII